LKEGGKETVTAEFKRGEGGGSPRRAGDIDVSVAEGRNSPPLTRIKGTEKGGSDPEGPEGKNGKGKQVQIRN